ISHCQVVVRQSDSYLRVRRSRLFGALEVGLRQIVVVRGAKNVSRCDELISRRLRCISRRGLHPSQSNLPLSIFGMILLRHQLRDRQTYADAIASLNFKGSPEAVHGSLVVTELIESFTGKNEDLAPSDGSACRGFLFCQLDILERLVAILEARIGARE